MSGKSTTSVLVTALVLAVAFVEYVRIAKTIPIKQHEEELASVRAGAEEKVKEAENHYRQAVAEEAHRREMSLLFEKATARAISANVRLKVAAINLSTPQVDTESLPNAIRQMARPLDDALAKEAHDARAAFAKERDDAFAKETKEANEAHSQFTDAMADAKYAKTELERLGVMVAWPKALLSVASDP